MKLQLLPSTGAAGSGSVTLALTLAAAVAVAVAGLGCASSQQSRRDQATRPTPPLIQQPVYTTSADVGQTRQAIVTQTAPPSSEDKALTQVVRSELDADPALRDTHLENVNITVINGRAIMTGKVMTIADSATIEQRVRDVHGIRAVKNELEVLSRP